MTGKDALSRQAAIADRHLSSLSEWQRTVVNGPRNAKSSGIQSSNKSSGWAETSTIQAKKKIK